MPDHLIGKSWNGKYRGQTQKWLALRFTGVDSEIDLAPPGHKQEFDQWRWAHMDELMDLIVPFKRQVYEQVLAEFRHLGKLPSGLAAGLSSPPMPPKKRPRDTAIHLRLRRRAGR